MNNIVAYVLGTFFLVGSACAVFDNDHSGRNQNLALRLPYGLAAAAVAGFTYGSCESMMVGATAAVAHSIMIPADQVSRVTYVPNQRSTDPAIHAAIDAGLRGCCAFSVVSGFEKWRTSSLQGPWMNALCVGACVLAHLLHQQQLQHISDMQHARRVPTPQEDWEDEGSIASFVSVSSRSSSNSLDGEPNDEVGTILYLR